MIFIKDIPLTALRNYMAYDYLETIKFKGSIELYNELNNTYLNKHEISVNSGFSFIYNSILIELLINKYFDNESFGSSNKNDLRKFKLCYEGQKEILLSLNTNIKIDNPIPNTLFKYDYIIIKRKEKETNLENIKSLNNEEKNKFNLAYELPVLESENPFINIKNSMIYEKNPVMNTYFRDKMESMYLSLSDYSIADLNDKYSFLVNEITRNELNEAYSTIINIFIEKYKGTDINTFLDIRPTVSNIKNIVYNKYFSGIAQDSIINNNLNSSDIYERFKLYSENVIMFLNENDIMQDYNIVG